MDPLDAAILRGDCESVAALVDSGARIDVRDGSGNYPTALSISHEHWQVLRFLLERGAPLDEEYSLRAAIGMSDLERVRGFCRSGRANLVDDTGSTSADVRGQRSQPGRHRTPASRGRRSEPS